MRFAERMFLVSPRGHHAIGDIICAMAMARRWNDYVFGICESVRTVEIVANGPRKIDFSLCYGGRHID